MGSKLLRSSSSGKREWKEYISPSISPSEVDDSSTVIAVMSYCTGFERRLGLVNGVAIHMAVSIKIGLSVSYRVWELPTSADDMFLPIVTEDCGTRGGVLVVALLTSFVCF